MNYFHLLYDLFHSSHGGDGRFELLNEDVLSLPDMLERLNRKARSAEGPTRDMFIVRFLTVPLRLTHLIPYLSYAMKPSALALRGNADLVSHGLRMLELCIDNLTPNFLGPTLTALGGRNRKMLERESLLKYRANPEPLRARFSFGPETPMSVWSVKTFSSISKIGPQYRPLAYNYLEQCLSLALPEDVKGREREDLFVRYLYDAIHVLDVHEEAEKTSAELFRSLFTSTSEAKKALELVDTSIRELVAMATTSEVPVNDVVITLHQIASRFLSLCLEKTWARWSAGCGDIRLMTNIPDLGVRWVNEREVVLVRMLLHVLKDMPHDCCGRSSLSAMDSLAKDGEQSSLDIIKHRDPCIKFPTASIPMTDFLAKQHQIRQRVTTVYFKSLYSPNPEIKEVAHEGLRMVLAHQSRLPKELLQTGLRPILMNLADPKHLPIPGLEGLARPLELLTNYFKVEIGHKLLNHFRIVADPQMLQASSRLPDRLADVAFLYVLLNTEGTLAATESYAVKIPLVEDHRTDCGLTLQAQYFTSADAVPFRFTPNLQHFLGPILTEGILACGIMSINELEHQLYLFAPDEVMTWLHQHHGGKVPRIDISFRLNVATNIESVFKQAETTAYKIEREQAL
ncbi:hypothetical protein C8Q73DRAFT_791215 [Cubamyces lactineus]|nr:hypothetical protein C8Q73DRAFT_791215 [Cubamyces lactineus]